MMKKHSHDHSSPPEFNPRCLIEAAVRIDRARKQGDKGSLAEAVDTNRKIWADIHDLAERPNAFFPKDFCAELTRLSDYVWSATRSKGADINDMVLDTLINIDLQISEGLLYKDRH